MKKVDQKGIIHLGEPSISHFWSKFGVFISLCLIFLGALGLVFIQPELKQTQDVRKDASVASGLVLVSPVPVSGTTFTVQTPVTHQLAVNTQNLQTVGVELVFNVITQVTDTLNVSVLPSSGLVAAVSEVQTTTDGFLVRVMALPQTFGTNFSSNQAVPFIQLSYTPTTTGPVTIAFDAENSYSVVAGTTQDQLKTISDVSYTIVSATTPSPSPSPSVSPSPSPSATPMVSPSPTPVSTPTVTPTPTPSATPATGGFTGKSCNETCSSNSECRLNHRCYEGRCRLVTNVSSDTCATTTSSSLNRQCNETCGGSEDCASGLTCFYNKCRRADNPDSTACGITTSAIQKTIADNCNQACSSNAGCAVNMRCYNGSCRLATNPSSGSCSAPTSSTVSVIYTQPTGPEKGDDLSGDGYGTDNDPKSDLNSANGASGSSSVSASPVVLPGTVKPSPTPSPRVTDKSAAASSSAWLNRVANFFNMPATSLPVLSMGIGLGLLLFLIILYFLTRLFRGRRSPQPLTNLKSATYENDLQAKINDLRSQASGNHTPVTPVVTAQPPLNRDVPLSPPPSRIMSTPVPTSSTPVSSTSSMLERIKQKGITPPQSSQE